MTTNISEASREQAELLPCEFPERYIQRFLAKINRVNECWNWMGCENNRGYGKVSAGVKGKSVLAHRRSYEIFNGPIPEGKNILHKCNNEACVNPEHLYAGNQSDNYDDMRKAGTAPLGERNGHAKLTSSVIRQIRLLQRSGFIPTEIARALSVSYESVYEVTTGRNWNHV